MCGCRASEFEGGRLQRDKYGGDADGKIDVSLRRKRREFALRGGGAAAPHSHSALRCVREDRLQHDQTVKSEVREVIVMESVFKASAGGNFKLCGTRCDAEL